MSLTSITNYGIDAIYGTATAATTTTCYPTMTTATYYGDYTSCTDNYKIKYYLQSNNINYKYNIIPNKTSYCGSINYRWLTDDSETRTDCGYLLSNSEWAPRLSSPQEQLRKAMAQRLAPAIHILRKALTPAEERETRARETLRRVIGDEKYQKYLRCGFVTVRNPRNGFTYQCFPGHGGVKVWKDGQMVESWCVLLQGNFPPTDQLITRYLMVLNNPDQLRAIANVSRGNNRARQPQQVMPQEDLVKLFKKLKAA
jgi:hypothetical protein